MSGQSTDDAEPDDDVVEVRPGIAMANRPEDERIEKFTLTPRSPEDVEDEQ